MNLMALPTRFSTIWRSLTGSPTTASGISSARSRSVPGACGSRTLPEVDGVLEGLPQAEFNAFEVQLPASILEKSRISLMMSRRLVPERVKGFGQGPLLGRQRRRQQQFSHSQDAVHGVRISWLILARNWDFA